MRHSGKISGVSANISSFAKNVAGLFRQALASGLLRARSARPPKCGLAHGRRQLGALLMMWAPAVAFGLGVSGCSEDHHKRTEQSISFVTTEPGSAAVPTNDASFRLLSYDGPRRFSVLRELIASDGRKCDAVTTAVLKGGLDGTDEWLAKCTDTGKWTIWFRPHTPPEVLRCSATTCR